MRDKSYVLQKDIVIKAGTVFDNHSREAKDGCYLEAVVGISKDCVEWFRIDDMDEILQHEPTFFRVEENN